MKRACSLSSVLIFLTVLVATCGDPTPTPRTLPATIATFTPASTTAGVLTPAVVDGPNASGIGRVDGNGGHLR